MNNPGSDGAPAPSKNTSEASSFSEATSGEWKEYTFKDLYLSPSRNGLTKPSRIRGEGCKFINMKEIFAYDFISSVPCERVPMTEKEIENFYLKEGDLLFARQSLVLEGAGKIAIFLGDSEPVTFESHLIRVRLDQTLCLALYMFYFFRSYIGKSLIYSIVEQGAGAAGIRGSDLAELKIPLPPLPEQKRIAHILGTLDDKIELNRCMNETLESMAQALFKSWFVDFDPVIDNALLAGNPIPDELRSKAELRRLNAEKNGSLTTQHSKFNHLFPSTFTETEELGWIPEGWEVSSLSKQITITGGGTPKKSEPDYWDGEIPWFSVKDAPNESDVFVIDTEQKITELGLKKSSAKLLPVGTTIITARGTVGKLALVGTPMAMNQSCYGINAIEPNIPCYNYLRLKTVIDQLQQNTHGAVFDTITTKTFESIDIVIPETAPVAQFEEKITHTYKQIKNNLEQKTTLIGLRNSQLIQFFNNHNH